MNFNQRLFFAINKTVGQKPWLDALGRAGAEWVIVAMIGWYVASALIGYLPNFKLAIWPILFLGTSWAFAWVINLFIGLIVKEPRPHVKFLEARLLFTPLMSWKSFPSDHAMSAWLIFFMAAIFQLPFFLALLPLAFWISWGRIFAGVHYPLDILGGVGVAGFVAALAAVLLGSLV
ncbi:MAG: phosphatase PAP2 family protein [Candidatus Azambacteria bacterium]|nr:phosphatase PAP2 family protein [Candidatus Azambacteria bacterium]